MKAFKNNPFLQRKLEALKSDPTAKVAKMIDKLPLKRRCRMMVNMPTLPGVNKKQVLLDGLSKDWAQDKKDGKYKTVDEALAPCRKETDFTWMLRKLGVTWAEVEDIAKEVFN